MGVSMLSISKRDQVLAAQAVAFLIKQKLGMTQREIIRVLGGADELSLATYGETILGRGAELGHLYLSSAVIAMMSEISSEVRREYPYWHRYIMVAEGIVVVHDPGTNLLLESDLDLLERALWRIV